MREDFSCLRYFEGGKGPIGIFGCQEPSLRLLLCYYKHRKFVMQPYRWYRRENSTQELACMSLVVPYIIFFFLAKMSANLR